jgi:3-oxoacyl-ACP reductase-like protein
VIQLPVNQSVDAFEIQTPTGTVLFSIDKNGNITSGGTAGPQAGLEVLGVAHAVYNFAVDGGAISTIVPALNAVIPINALIVGASVNSPTAVTGTAGALVAIGTSAGSSAASILAATAITAFTLDAVAFSTVPTFAAPVKMTAAGSIAVTPSVHALTAGVIEIFVYYVVAQGA